MNKAQRRAVEFRRKLGLRGQVDAEGVANILGLEVIPWALRAQEEMRIDRYMCIAEDLEPDERRWMIAHSIGHWFLHPGNHLWIYKHTSFGGRIEREANDFACAMLLDVEEALEARRSGLWASAEVTDSLWPSKDQRTRPLMPLRKGHMAMLIAAGFLDNLQLEADGRRILVKGKTTKGLVLVEETPDKVTYRERLRTTVVALDLGDGVITDIAA